MKEKIYEENRPWGSFREFTKNTPSTLKILAVHPNEVLSLQSHKERSEFWRVLSGSGIAEVDDKKTEIKKGDEIRIPLGSKHRLSAGSEGLEVLEIAMGNFDENDITRYQDKYGRI